MTIEVTFLVASILLIISIIATRASNRFGVPALILFLAIGMLAGSEGPGGIDFADYQLAQTIGVIALIYILFSGGLDTDWQAIRPVLIQGALLANVGVLLSALIVCLFAVWVLQIGWIEALLLGAVVSSTDAAAVFSVMRDRQVNLKHNLEPLIELESGSNDPIAVFLTLGLTGLITTPGSSLVSLVPDFVLQMVLGAGGGYLMGLLIVLAINRIRLKQEGLYVVFTLGLTLLTYAATALIGGNGFLAVYLAGIVIGNKNIVHKRSILRFHDGIAWLMQITMFLSLGLLIFPSQLLPVAVPGLLLALLLVFVARPVSVLLSLIWFRRSWRELAMVSWAGLRGAVPIVLATFPLLAGVPSAGLIFNVVFFIVLISVLLQGLTIAQVARWLGLSSAEQVAPSSQTFVPEVRLNSRLVEAVVPEDSALNGLALIEIGLPRGLLVVQVQRGAETIIPSGSTVILTGDHLLLLVTPDTLPVLHELRDQAGLELLTQPMGKEAPAAA
jgi:cell volume regulation protein A